MTPVKKIWLAEGPPSVGEAIVEGRVHRLALLGADTRQLVCWNVHNFDLSVEQMNYFAGRLGTDLHDAAANSTVLTVVVAGDWSYTAEGETGFAFSQAEQSFRTVAAAPAC